MDGAQHEEEGGPGAGFATGTKRDHEEASARGAESGGPETKRPRVEGLFGTQEKGERNDAGASDDEDEDDYNDDDDDDDDSDDGFGDSDDGDSESESESDEGDSTGTDLNISKDGNYEDEEDEDDEGGRGTDDGDGESYKQKGKDRKGSGNLRASARIKAIQETTPKQTESTSDSPRPLRPKHKKRRKKGEEKKGSGREKKRGRKKRRSRRSGNALEGVMTLTQKKEFEEAEAKRQAVKNEQNQSWTYPDMSETAIDQRRKDLLDNWRFFSAVHFLEKFGLLLELPKTIPLGNELLESFIGYFGGDGLQHVHYLHIHLLKLLKVRAIDLASPSSRQVFDPKTGESITLVETGWHRALRLAIKRHYTDFPEGNPLEHTLYNTLPLADRIALLHMLCEWISTDTPLIRDCLERAKIEEQIHRPLPLGYDESGAAYWRFGSEPNLVLYKEVEPKMTRSQRPTNSNWEIVCSHLDHWYALAERFETSQHPDEIEFRSYLLEELIPPLVSLQRAKNSAERRMKREAIEAANILGTRRSVRSRKTINYAEVITDPARI